MGSAPLKQGDTVGATSWNPFCRIGKYPCVVRSEVHGCIHVAPCAYLGTLHGGLQVILPLPNLQPPINPLPLLLGAGGIVRVRISKMPSTRPQLCHTVGGNGKFRKTAAKPGRGYLTPNHWLRILSKSCPEQERKWEQAS